MRPDKRAAARRGRLPLPAPADPRRRLRRAAEGGAGRAARALRRLAGRARRRPRRARRDPRLPPRAGVPLPRRARARRPTPSWPGARDRDSTCRQARARKGDAAAIGLLERAVALLPSGDYDGDLELTLSDALFVGGRPDEGAAAVDIPRGAGTRSGDRVIELTAELYRATARLFVDPTAGMDALEELIERRPARLEAAGDPLAVRLWFAIATIAHGRLQNLSSSSRPPRRLPPTRGLRVTSAVPQDSIPYAVSSRFFGPVPVEESLAWIEEQEPPASCMRY